MAITSTYVFPVEGLTYLMNVVPKGTASTTLSGSIYLGLWGQSTAANLSTWSTISGVAGNGNVAFTLNSGQASPAGITVYEQAAFGTNAASISGYVNRIPLTNSAWGAVTSGTTVTGPNAALPIVYSTYSSALNITNNGSYTVSGIGGIFLAIGGSGNAVGSTSGPSCTVLWYAPFTDLNTVTLASGDSIAITPTWQTAAFQS
jgi:hypothetical protein